MSRARAGTSGVTHEPEASRGSASMITRRMQVEKNVGRVLIGPKKISQGYARIVANRDGSGRIESFDPLSKMWVPAPESITFSVVWSAPSTSF